MNLIGRLTRLSVHVEVELTGPAGEVDRPVFASNGQREAGELEPTRSARRPGSRSRSRSDRVPATSGTSTVTWTSRPCRSIENETGPKLVGASSTLIVFPSASQARGVENASSSPRGAPSGPRVSWTSISRSVSRNVALPPRFGGRYIARYDEPPSGATVLLSPETYVSGVIAAASVP